MKTLLPLTDSLGIQSYGLAVASGLLLSIYRIKHHPLRKHFISTAHLNSLITGSVFVGLCGGKLLFFLLNQTSYSLLLFSGGFSFLGTLGSILLFIPFYTWYKGLLTLPILDLFALHAPLFQSIARLGCFFAGCCYGTSTNLPWAIIYTDTNSFSPLDIPLHPTQLYSALLLGIMYVLLSYSFSKHEYKPGKLVFMYLALVSVERFFIDFLRGDREFLYFSWISIHQCIALLFFISAASICFLYRTKSIKTPI